MELQKVQRQIQKGSTRLTPKIEKLRQMSFCYPIELAFYCLCVLLFFFIIFTIFSLLVFLLFLLCLVFLVLFICLIVLFDWFSLFSIAFYFFLFSLHSCSNNTLLLIVYFLFWLSKSYISCHIIVLSVLL